MPRAIQVISGDGSVDGVGLRRRKRAGMYVQCDGKSDDQNIQDAMNTASRSRPHSGYGPGMWKKEA